MLFFSFKEGTCSDEGSDGALRARLGMCARLCGRCTTSLPPLSVSVSHSVFASKLAPK